MKQGFLLMCHGGGLKIRLIGICMYLRFLTTNKIKLSIHRRKRVCF